MSDIVVNAVNTVSREFPDVSVEAYDLLITWHILNTLRRNAASGTATAYNKLAHATDYIDRLIKQALIDAQ